MKANTVAVLLILLASKLMAQTAADFEHRLYETYVEGKMKEWPAIINDLQASYQKTQQKELLYSLCFAQYGYIGYCISEEKEKEAKEILKDARNNANELENIYQGRHDVLALEGALIGFQIMLSKFTALYLGPRAYRLINEASASSDIYYNCSLEIGNMRYFTPQFLGGSKEEAIEYYKNAVEIIENNSKKDVKNWKYINTVLFLANAYFDTGSKDLACKLYQEILVNEPGAKWIRDDMLKKCNDQ